MRGQLAGYGVLLRAHRRTDRRQVVIWIVVLTALYWSQAISVDGLYADQAEFDAAAGAMGGNPAFLALAGPARALNTIGGQVIWQASAFGGVLVGLMSMFLVGRHTRVEEETGRDELLRSAPVGRLAGFTSALTVAIVANLLVGLAVAGSLASYPLAASDSLATGLGLTCVGWAFTGVALLAAQLTASVRSMYAIAGSVIAAAYGLRAVGDVTDSALSWLSPIGWYQGMHQFSGVRWWPALLLLVAGASTLVVAWAVLNRRDWGAGVLPTRPGPARGSLGSATGLAWRLQRPSVFGWGLGLLATGASLGSIGDQVGELVGDSASTRDLLAPGGVDVSDGFYGTALLMIGLLATGFAVSSALRPRAEEDSGLAELLLTTGLSRRAWLAGFTVVTLLGSLALLGAGGLALGLSYGATTGHWGQVLRLCVPALNYAAPAWVCSALALALTGVRPRWAAASWGLVGWACVVLLFAEVLRFPGWLRGLSPFDHVALMPAEAFALGPVVVQVALAAALVAAASFALSRRDIQ